MIPFKGWKIGLLICADMRFFEISTPLKNMGADVILYPSAWIAGWKELLHLCGRMRAAENQIYTIALNRASATWLTAAELPYGTGWQYPEHAGS